MGQYKVPQDVEAEDKIIGPLTLKQFIYAVIGVAWGGIAWTLFKGAPVIFVIVGLPPAILFIMLGLYRRQDQPFEVYLSALFTYFGQSRKRIWEKEPIEEVFKVDAPIVKAELAQRDPREVIGQLDRLARIVDTRGYSTKQPELQEPATGALIMPEDRLAQPTPVPAAAITPAEVALSEDMLDFDNNTTARNLNVLIADSAQTVRQEALNNMAAPNLVRAASAQAPSLVQPLSAPTADAGRGARDENPLAAILKTAMASSDLTVSDIAAQAARQQQPLAENQTVNLRNPN